MRGPPPPPRGWAARTARTHSSAAAASRVTVVSIVAEPKRTARRVAGPEEAWLLVAMAKRIDIVGG